MICNKNAIAFEMIRHGETYYNVMPGGARGQGITDDADAQLTEKGRNQAAKAAEFMADLIEKREIPAYTKIISSPLGRARETAEIIQQALDKNKVSLETDERLSGRNWGVYEKTLVSKTYTELENMSGVAYSAQYPDWKPEGGESRNEVVARVIIGIKERLEGCTKDDHILFVVHNENIRVLLAGSQSIPNCGWIGFEYNPTTKENFIEYKWTKDTQV